MEKDTKDGRVEGGKKASEGGRGDPEKASPVAVERYLKGIRYPAGKADLEKTAKKNRAPSDVLSVLSRFDDKEYKSPIDIAKEVGNVE
ncbi:DUF2795 domain-containing protein [Holosporaceae bacterium 'Namur']|nr:DUF2795 domain-containing protein [Holosporaceae bacterium 'Namur']